MEERAAVLQPEDDTAECVRCGRVVYLSPGLVSKWVHRDSGLGWCGPELRGEAMPDKGAFASVDSLPVDHVLQAVEYRGVKIGLEVLESARLADPNLAYRFGRDGELVGIFVDKQAMPAPAEECEFCGPSCIAGAAHNARAEDKAYWRVRAAEAVAKDESMRKFLDGSWG